MKPALFALEAAINQYLQLDPDTPQKLAKLNGKIIQVELSDWHTSLYLQVATHGLNVFDHWDGDPDTVISGKLFNLLHIGLNQANSQSLFENQVTLRGDIRTGQQIQTIIENIDIDWEAHLAKITGDTLAHKFMAGAKQAWDAITDCADSIKDQTHNYIHHEAQLTPTQTQLNAFTKQVTQLRHDVERLAVKIQRQQPSEPQ